MKLRSIAIRNLLRHRRRSLFTALAIAVGALALVFFQGFIEGFIDAGIDASVLRQVGAIQIQRKGYIGADEPLKLALFEDPDFLARVTAVDGVVAVAPRLAFDGMISNGAESTLFTAVAIDPARESAVCPRRSEAVTPGSAPLSPGAPSRALLGRALAGSLGARRGSSLIMQSASPESAGTNALDVEVTGTLSTRDFGESKHLVTVPLAFARDLLRMPKKLTSYAVGVRDMSRVTEVADRIRKTTGPDYQVTTWQDVDVPLGEQIAQARFIFGFVGLSLYVLVAGGVVNTMNLSVQERIREMGAMLAMGMKRRQILALFLWEAAALGAVSGAAGALAGWAVIGAIGVHGVALHPPGGDMLRVHPDVGAAFVASVVIFAALGAVVAALRPAWRGARRSPVEALGAR